MTTLTAIHVRDTGHVLAAVTRSAPPTEGHEPAAILVGGGLPLRSVGLSPPDVITVPADRLATATVDTEAVLEDPRRYGVIQVEQNGDKKNEVQQLKSEAANRVAITLTATGAQVSYPGTVDTVAHAVLVIMEQAGPPKILSGSIPANASTVTLLTTLPAGSWRTLTLVSGFVLHAVEQTV
jgi:hypothetical protein